MIEAPSLGEFLTELARRPRAEPGFPLWDGIDPVDPSVRRYIEGCIRAGFDPTTGGMTPAVAAAAAYLEESAMANLRMRVARRAGVPYSEVVERWTAEDLAMEAGQDLRDAIDTVDRCDECRVAEHEVLDEETSRWLPNGKWKIEEHSCPWCRELAAMNEGLDENARRDRVRFRTTARLPGDERVEVASRPQLG